MFVMDAASRLLGSTDKDKVPDNGNLDTLLTVFELTNNVMRRKEMFDAEFLERISNGKFLFVSGTSGKPIWMYRGHLGWFRVRFAV